MTSKPIVTVGLMVYNEIDYIEETVRTWLDQDLQSLELLIVDNASTDGTREKLLELAQFDERVKLILRDRNEGAYSSVATLLDRATTPFFVLSGGHDLFPSNYLSSLAAVLQEDPDVALVTGRLQLIAADGSPNGFSGPLLDTRHVNDPVTRLALGIWCDAAAIHGMFRTSVLKKIRFEKNFFAAIWLLLCEVSLRGTFACVSDVVWQRRMPRAPLDRDAMITRYYQILFERPRRPLLPHWTYFIYAARATFRSPGGAKARLRIAFVFVGGLARWIMYLIDDIKRFPSRLVTRSTERPA
ncbi:MAG: glycosyltransferase family 2 protein [Candidatus Dadabacteria bacterium]|nr:MAG: glycosyltransferase family 2 protein [Candidatus Dadabacteria bacterium]